MSKDAIKFDIYLNLRVENANEYAIMMKLFVYHDVVRGYSLLKCKDLMKCLHTTSYNRVSKTLKSLEKKGMILIERSHRKNNRYYITNIEKFIDTVNEVASEIENKEISEIIIKYK